MRCRRSALGVGRRAVQLGLEVVRRAGLSGEERLREPATLAAMYGDNARAFFALKRELDPGCVLRNEFLARIFGDLLPRRAPRGSPDRPRGRRRSGAPVSPGELVRRSSRAAPCACGACAGRRGPRPRRAARPRRRSGRSSRGQARRRCRPRGPGPGRPGRARAGPGPWSRARSGRARAGPGPWSRARSGRARAGPAARLRGDDLGPRGGGERARVAAAGLRGAGQAVGPGLHAGPVLDAGDAGQDACGPR